MDKQQKIFLNTLFALQDKEDLVISAINKVASVQEQQTTKPTTKQKKGELARFIELIIV